MPGMYKSDICILQGIGHKKRLTARHSKHYSGSEFFQNLYNQLSASVNISH